MIRVGTCGAIADGLAMADTVIGITASAVDTTERAGFGYSYGLFVSLDPRKPVVAHDGGIDGFLSHLSHNSATGLTVVVLTNHEDAPNLDVVVDSLTQAASA